MRYKELTVATSHKYADIVAAVLSENNYEGVAVYDKQDYLDLKDQGLWDYADDSLKNQTDQVFVQAYFYPDSNIDEYLDELKRLKSINPDFEYTVDVSIKDDSAYRDEWKKYFKPIEFEKLAVVPQWIDDYKTDKPIILINPSMAFGTGAHQTTRMCLEAMQKLEIKDKTVLDVGCGSGILGLGALALGARKVIMIDNDQSAVKVAQENLEYNAMTDRAELVWGVLGDVDAKADIIFANITADILIGIKDLLIDRLKPEGTLVLSGIIYLKLSELKKAFESLQLIEHNAMDDWHCLIYKKG
ncbi:MAG TPA: 50S ribosomal protein L11 methyltransferase [Clostridia bacterium]